MTRKAIQQRQAREERARANTAAEALDDYDDTFLECRDLHHPWRIRGFFRIGGEIHRALTCARCKTEAIDVWKPNGERVKRRYNYVAGYNIKGSSITPFDVRREVLSRVTIYDTQEQMLQSLLGAKKRSA